MAKGSKQAVAKGLEDTLKKAKETLSDLKFQVNKDTLQTAIDDAVLADVDHISLEDIKELTQSLKDTIREVKKSDSVYPRLMERIFLSKYDDGDREILFTRDDIIETANNLAVKRPKNLGDLIYSFRYRTLLPESVRNKAPNNEEWIILPDGPARYRFALTRLASIIPNKGILEIKVPDSTPGIISMHALGDEQAILTRLRYNRLIDIFTHVTCYSLQNHLRTTVSAFGKTQVETDEVYVGVDSQGAHYVFPIQVKRGKDILNVVQIWQDYFLCKDKFPKLICRPIAAQLMHNNVIALFEFIFDSNRKDFAIKKEKHYRLLPANEITDADLAQYRQYMSTV